MPNTIFQVELHRVLGCKIVFWKLNPAVEDGDCVCVLQLGVRGARAMTLRAHSVPFGAQQLRMFPAVRIVASGAALLKSRLVKNSLVSLFGLIDVTIQADVNGIRLGKCARLSGVRIVAIRAISLGSRMLELRLLDLVGLFGMTPDANVFDLRLGENDLPVLGSFVADLAQLLAEGRMHKSLHELRLNRLVRIVTGHAIGFAKGLPTVRLDQARVAGVVTFKTERRRGFRKVMGEFRIRFVARLVRDVAGIATQVESLVPASTLGNVQPRLVASQTQVLGGRGT